MSEDSQDNFHIISANKVRLPGGSECANCRMRMDGASAVETAEKRMPRPGDGGICCFCGALLIYEEKLTTHVMSEDELASFKPEMQTLLKEHSKLFKKAAALRAGRDTFTIIKLPTK